VVACVVVEVKVQQRRPDGGSIPPIARIVFLFGLAMSCCISVVIFLLMRVVGTDCENFGWVVGMARAERSLGESASTKKNKKALEEIITPSRNCEPKERTKRDASRENRTPI
jgi:hypothetical protein